MDSTQPKNCGNEKKPISKLRKSYIARLVFRCLTFAVCALLCIYMPEQFTVLEGMNFFRSFSLLHVLWVIWAVDILFQLLPVQKKLPLGSKKHFKHSFVPIVEKINYKALREYVISTTKSAYKVFIIWAAMLIALGLLRRFSLLGSTAIFMVSVFFYVCDLICVLIWCPFRLIMKNRCCTTCRIFNWDHLMMFSPLIFVGGFYCMSLVLLSIAAWLLWELCVMMYPERFWEHSNEALRCSSCTDKLCTQYCQKLR